MGANHEEKEPATEPSGYLRSTHRYRQPASADNKPRLGGQTWQDRERHCSGPGVVTIGPITSQDARIRLRSIPRCDCDISLTCAHLVATIGLTEALSTVFRRTATKGSVSDIASSYTCGQFHFLQLPELFCHCISPTTRQTIDWPTREVTGHFRGRTRLLPRFGHSL